MTVRERVIASRLIQKAEKNARYTKQIGLGCELRKIEFRESENAKRNKRDNLFEGD